MRTRLARNLEPREKHALAALGLAAIVFLFLQLVVLPFVDSAEKQRAALPLKEKTLRKYQRLVAVAGLREADWQNSQARLAEAEKGLLDSRAPALASAELRERLKQLMAQQGLELRAADFLPVRPLKPVAAGYVAVPLSLAFECTLDQLFHLLLAARAYEKTLALEQLSVDAGPSRPDRPKTLAVRLVIYGVMEAEPVSPGSQPKAEGGG